jgi:hypothetical protein
MQESKQSTTNQMFWSSGILFYLTFVWRPFITLKVKQDTGKEGTNDKNDIANVLKYSNELSSLQRYVKVLQEMWFCN